MKKLLESQLLLMAVTIVIRSVRWFGPCTYIIAALLCLSVATFGQADPSKVGKWDPPMEWPNVAIHMHVLPDGKVMFWSRREWGPQVPLPNPQPGRPSLDPHESVPRLWDPENPSTSPVALQSPALRGSADEVNLFCSGHTFLRDGKLFVVGGHLDDSRGTHKVRIYDPPTGTWAIGQPMGPPGHGGRWYPTAVTLADGSVLVASGTDQGRNLNTALQIWKNGTWSKIGEFNDIPLYPWMHLAPDGRTFLSGPSKARKTQLLNTANGQWEVVGDTFHGEDREYGNSVMFDLGKVLIIGGGIPPQKTAEMIDLTQAAPHWVPAGEMSIGRRQQNATLLPDGTVLVTGGTSGKQGPNNGFNDLTTPVLKAELWVPRTNGPGGDFVSMASESIPRLYHSTAVLLPDARILSAGGGEYRPDNVADNDPKDSQRNAQIFSPPYLFRGNRPDITSAPVEVTYGQTFDLGTSDPAAVGQVTWLRLSSVTHSFNGSQRINFLKFASDALKLRVTAPTEANACPPGHYMLFVLNKDKVPSVAKIIQIH